MMTLRFAQAVTLGTLLFASPVLAQEARDPEGEQNSQLVPARRKFSDRPFTVQIRTGVDTLVGLIGLAASYDVDDHLALGLGFGTNAAGLQLAALARVRPFIWQNHRTRTLKALGFEASYSTGPTRWVGVTIPADGSGMFGLDEDTLHWNRVHWLAGEVVYEVRTLSGFGFTVGSGLAVAAYAKGAWCSGDVQWCASDARSSPGVLWTVTVGLGHTL